MRALLDIPVVYMVKVVVRSIACSEGKLHPAESGSACSVIPIVASQEKIRNFTVVHYMSSTAFDFPLWIVLKCYSPFFFLFLGTRRIEVESGDRMLILSY